MKDIVKGNVIVGYKKLSPAELGRTSSTTMTHIGLTKGFLNILNSDNDHKIEISNCKFYFQLNSSNSSCIVNCITQANGIKRSPKMTSVGNTKGTIVKEIKKIAFGNSQEYFLVWQVLETKSDFLLVEKDSEDFALIQDLEEGEFDEKKLKNFMIIKLFFIQMQ